MHQLRVRLRDLVGDLARQVAVHTYHSLALRLTERSMAARVEAAGQEQIDFDGIVDEANRRLRSEEQVVGMEPDELRDRLLSGFEYVLVDEYQDIDARQYELITHIARRAGEDEDRDRCATILAVGDDDQSIYEWRDASVRFLRQFEEEFSAEPHHLVENYRSTQHIIDASNALIRHNRDRMKVGHSIRVAARGSGGLLLRGQRPAGHRSGGGGASDARWPSSRHRARPQADAGSSGQHRDPVVHRLWVA